MFPFCVLRIFCVDGVCAVSHRHSAVHNNTNTNLHHYLQFLAPTKKNINKTKIILLDWIIMRNIEVSNSKLKALLNICAVIAAGSESVTI